MTSIVHRQRTPSRTSRTARGRVIRPKGGSSISPASRVTCATPPRSFAARAHPLLCKGACTTSRATRTSPSALFTVGLRSCKHRSSFLLKNAASSHLIIRTASVASRDMSGRSSWRHRCGIPTQMLPRLAHRRAAPRPDPVVTPTRCFCAPRSFISSIALHGVQYSPSLLCAGRPARPDGMLSRFLDSFLRGPSGLSSCSWACRSGSRTQHSMFRNGN